jgi:hypothetical protein
MGMGTSQHGGDEFGKSPSSSLRGLDPPMIGAPTSIMIDGMVERESGVTPPPPPISVRAMIIGLVVMFLLGLALLTTVSRLPPSTLTGPSPYASPEEAVPAGQ